MKDNIEYLKSQDFIHQRTGKKRKIQLDLERGSKICKCCKTDKTLENFTIDKRFNVFVSNCIDCKRKKGVEHQRKLKETNKELFYEKCKISRRKCYLKKINETEEEYEKRKIDEGIRRIDRIKQADRVSIIWYFINNKYHKICPKCEKTKEISLFHKCTRENDSLDWQCKECKFDTHYQKHKERYKKEHQATRSIPENKEKRNSEHRLRYSTDFAYKLEYNLRGRVKSAFKQSGHKKNVNSASLFGCNIEQVKSYISSKFDEYMSWENLLSGDIHIDHILPCELFDFSDLRQIKVCFHYTNLQPLWAIDNLSKIDRLDDGRCAKSLSKEEKLIYLKSKGHNFTTPFDQPKICHPSVPLVELNREFAD